MSIDFDQIKQRTNDATYQRGRKIFREEELLNLTQYANTLEGYYQGSALDPYHIQVEFDDDKIKSATCTCGYKRADDCKHIIALLMLYATDPQLFSESQGEADQLYTFTKDELITLVRRMMSYYPDLSVLLDDPENTLDSHRSVQIEAYRQRLHDVLHHEIQSRRAPQLIYDLAEQAHAYAEQHHFSSAIELYQLVLDEALNPDHFAFDDSGRLVYALNDITQGLASLLFYPEVYAHAGFRLSIFNILLDAYRWQHDTRWQALVFDVPETILSFIGEEEHGEIVVRVAQSKSAYQDQGKLQISNQYANFLTYLNALQDNQSAIVEFLESSEKWQLTFYFHLTNHRFDEAIELANHYLTGDDLLVVLKTLKTVDIGAAVSLAEDKLQSAFDDRIASWLIKLHRQEDDYTSALNLQRRRMASFPTLSNYVYLSEIARILGQWETIRPRILNWLDENKHYELLTEIYLEESHWQDAWNALEKAASVLQDWRYRELSLQVAEESRFALPAKALDVYVEQALVNIEAKKRENYQQAVHYLMIAKTLYQQLNRESEWEQRISEIKNKYNNLSAFQEEIQNASL